MQRSMVVWINNPDDSLISTIEQYNSACNSCLEWGYNNKTYNKSKIHDATYYQIRELYPNLQASLVCAARDQAADMLKREKLKCLPRKKTHSGIRFNVRTISVSSDMKKLSISTIEGRFRLPFKIPNYFKKYGNGELCAATMSLKNDKIKLSLTFKFDDVPLIYGESVLGIDRGIINPVVTSSNVFFNSNHLRNIKGKYQHLRSELQSKGTHSAKRKLKKIAGKETRFVSDVNHCMSKIVADMPFNVFILEDLTHIKSKSKGRKFNRKIGNWSFSQFSRYLEYKAEDRGKSVVYVDPRYTSQTCSICGQIKKSNRRGSTYTCDKCHLTLNADLNAARNIAHKGKSLLSRLPVNQPIVTS